MFLNVFLALKTRIKCFKIFSSDLFVRYNFMLVVFVITVGNFNSLSNYINYIYINIYRAQFDITC